MDPKSVHMDKHCYFLVFKWRMYSPRLNRSLQRTMTFQLWSQEQAWKDFKIYKGFTGNRFDSCELWGPASLIAEAP